MFDIKGRHPHCSLKSVWLKYWQIFLYIQSFSSVSFVPAILAVLRWNSECQFIKEIFIGDKKWIFYITMRKRGKIMKSKNGNLVLVFSDPDTEPEPAGFKDQHF